MRRASETTWPTNHPRACGENRTRGADFGVPSEPSLRVQGELRDRQSRRQERRTIPAAAGKTSHRWYRFPAGPNHARGCGENFVADQAPVTVYEPSLHLQGKLTGLRHSRWWFRTIPAPAGRTLARPCGPPDGTNHPCACGENGRPHSARPGVPEPSLRLQGEPPGCVSMTAGREPSLRLRGEQAFHERAGKRVRTILAPAGRTRRGPSSPCPSSNHPCTCRENILPDSAAPVISEPSLRLQGEHQPDPESARPQRTIPAPAGRTLQLRTAASYLPNHPCACGENRPPNGPERPCCEPSLRLRGERQRHVGLHERERTIPAPAGRTSATTSAVARRANHPCACGENTRPRFFKRPSTEPSLRLRGELLLTCSVRSPLLFCYQPSRCTRGHRTGAV